MNQDSIESKVRQMFKYLGEEAIARALNIEVGLVRAILNGEAVKVEEREEKRPIGHVRFYQAAFRQKVIVTVRASGGLGSTFLAANLGRIIAEKTGVLLIDLCVWISPLDNVVSSDLLELFSTDFYRLDDEWERVLKTVEIDQNLHYLPCHPDMDGKAISETILEARKGFDAIILDAPFFDSRVAEAAGACTTLLLLYKGGVSEARRLVDCASKLPAGNRDRILITKGDSPSDADIKYLSDKLTTSGHIHLPAGEKGLVPRKSKVYGNLNLLVNDIYGRSDGRGILGRIFGIRG